MSKRRRNDGELLAATAEDPSAFTDRRPALPPGLVLSYFVRRVDQPEIAADLTAETFAAAR